jgi:hypothetical protein
MSTSRMLKKSWLRSAPALRFPCCAWVPARALLARAFAGTNPCGCALPAALGHRPKPSVAWAFAGTSVHRTLVRGAPSGANPFSGIKLHRSFIYFRFTPGFFSSQRKKRGFCSAPSFKHLRVRKMCGASLHRASRLPKIVFQEPASRCIVLAGSLNGSNYMQ